MQGNAGSAGGQSFKGYCEVLCLAVQREEARRDRDFKEGDRVRDKLKALGVECHDKTHSFDFKGLTGGYDLHAGLGPHEVQMVALEREEARRDRDYKRGDELRDWLTSKGIVLDDKSHTITAPDGVSASYDLQRWRPVIPMMNAVPRMTPQDAYRWEAAQREAAAREAAAYEAARREAAMRAVAAYPAYTRAASAYPAATRRAPPAQTSSGNRFTGFYEVLCLALEREGLRRDKKYGESDRLRSQLAQMGADCMDKTHTFTWQDLEGSYDLSVGVGMQELQYVALEREESRRDKDFGRSDALRDWLLQQGVQVHDKSHTFTTEAGVTGSYDLQNWEGLGSVSHSIARPAIGSTPPAKRHRI